MLRVAVVDDERLARQRMRQLLAKHPAVKLVGEAGSVTAAAELIRREKPDAIFLDIEMHGTDGFDLLRGLSDPPDIVFVTAHSQYAVKAYDFCATDYLLKPVDPKRFAAAVAKLEKARQARRDAEAPKRTDEVQVLRLKTRARTVVIRIDAIVALRAEGDYTSVVVEKMPSILAGQSLGRIEAMLPAARFIRLSRSLMINVARLREIETIDRDATRIHLHGCTDSFLVGRAAAARLRKRQLSGPA